MRGRRPLTTRTARATLHDDGARLESRRQMLWPARRSMPSGRPSWSTSSARRAESGCAPRSTRMAAKRATNAILPEQLLIVLKDIWYALPAVRAMKEPDGTAPSPPARRHDVHQESTTPADACAGNRARQPLRRQRRRHLKVDVALERLRHRTAFLRRRRRFAETSALSRFGTTARTSSCILVIANPSPTFSTVHAGLGLDARRAACRSSRAPRSAPC